MSKADTFKMLLKSDPKKIFRPLANYGIFNLIPDKTYLKWLFYFETGKKLNLKNPTTFNEKLQWLKLYDRKPHYKNLVDKYAVREYIEKTVGGEYLIPLIALYDSADEIDFDALPDRFVLKCTHGCGCNIICTDKKKLNIEETRKKLSKWLKKDYYKLAREWVYKDIKPRIVCEEFITDDPSQTPDDFKFLCFDGVPKFVKVISGRLSNVTQDIYDIEWNKTDISYKLPPSDKVLLKPSNFDEMKQLAEKLSQGFKHIRVDFYSVGGKIYFGELTFYNTSGLITFNKEEYNTYLGSFIKLEDRP